MPQCWPLHGTYMFSLLSLMSSESLMNDVSAFIGFFHQCCIVSVGLYLNSLFGEGETQSFNFSVYMSFAKKNKIS